MASWASTTQNWAGAEFTWAAGEYNLNVTAIFNAGLGTTTSNTLTIPVTATLGQGNSGVTDDGSSYLATLSTTLGGIASAQLIMSESLDFNLGGSVLNNTEYPEGVTFGTVLTANAEGTFLWTGIEEDTSEWTVVKKSG